MFFVSRAARNEGYALTENAGALGLRRWGPGGGRPRHPTDRGCAVGMRTPFDPAGGRGSKKMRPIAPGAYRHERAELLV